MIEIVNQQRKVKINKEDFTDFSLEILQTVKEATGKNVSVAFVSDSRMKDLNQTFRGKNQTTDVLSFPVEEEAFFAEKDFLGDIVISLEQANKQAEENNLTLELEIKQLILHGVLHLCGFDHETDDGEMNSLELQYRDKLKIS